MREGTNVYMLSSSSNPRDQDRALASPYVRGYLTKPLTPDQLESL